MQVVSGVLSYEEVCQRYSPELERRVFDFNCADGLLREMVCYHLATGGKRMRALLPVWVCANLGGKPETAFDLGAALELLHNATLVHDDLQDRDTHRRGVRTVWHRWSMAQAINAGDALIFIALERLARAPSAARVMKPIADALLRVAHGQTMELQFQRSPGSEWALAPNLEVWKEMARAKTGALFGACLRAGAAAAEQDDALLESASQYGEDIGLLYQVQDDYLDLVGAKGRLHRGSDLVEGKLSFPVLWAFEHGDERAVAPIRTVLSAPREERTEAMVSEALAALQKCGALAAVAAWLEKAQLSAESHSMARVIPGWAQLCLQPVSHAIGASTSRSAL